ncbi:RNA polymerase sigma factor [Bacillus sp. CGMCC 1.16607]|uniref:RNA polymerase sigma factor n=1 Tax=Bacillus sp. CGMCC 1.16607 TaxID=3351842 RepID=UPI003633CE3F
MQDQDELQWIKEVLEGDKQSYANIIDRYKNQLYATILRMTSNSQDAQDLVQEAFIKVYYQLAKYDGKGSFAGWLKRVAINHCIDEFRKNHQLRKQVNINEYIIENPNHPEIILLKKEEERQIKSLIHTLPEEERMIILLRFVNELSYEEISELLGITVSNVGIKLYRAKKKMRVLIKNEGGYIHEVFGN